MIAINLLFSSHTSRLNRAAAAIGSEILVVIAQNHRITIERMRKGVAVRQIVPDAVRDI
jgi:hypothetical protein